MRGDSSPRGVWRQTHRRTHTNQPQSQRAILTPADSSSHADSRRETQPGRPLDDLHNQTVMTSSDTSAHRRGNGLPFRPRAEGPKAEPKARRQAVCNDKHCIRASIGRNSLMRFIMPTAAKQNTRQSCLSHSLWFKASMVNSDPAHYEVKAYRQFKIDLYFSFSVFHRDEYAPMQEKKIERYGPRVPRVPPRDFLSRCRKGPSARRSPRSRDAPAALHIASAGPA